MSDKTATKVTFSVYPHQYSTLKSFFRAQGIELTDHARNEVICSLRVSRDSVSIYLPAMEDQGNA